MVVDFEHYAKHGEVREYKQIANEAAQHVVQLSTNDYVSAWERYTRDIDRHHTPKFEDE